ncbi:MAG: sulfite exporter TauE/SafE family protein, partial [Rhodobacteraceae bacterium]|nr:sulfite exporter TauE/SafE family protein [Paracoccaceae bacterium]
MAGPTDIAALGAALLSEAMAPEGALWLVAAACIAGLVRGFTGFGSGLVFMPVAMTLVPPVWALVVLLVMEITAPLTQLPRALRQGSPREVGLMAAGAALTLPPGLWLLVHLPPEALRWAVSIVAVA